MRATPLHSGFQAIVILRIKMAVLLHACAFLCYLSHLKFTITSVPSTCSSIALTGSLIDSAVSVPKTGAEAYYKWGGWRYRLMISL